MVVPAGLHYCHGDVAFRAQGLQGHQRHGGGFGTIDVCGVASI